MLVSSLYCKLVLLFFDLYITYIWSKKKKTLSGENISIKLRINLSQFLLLLLLLLLNQLNHHNYQYYNHNNCNHNTYTIITIHYSQHHILLFIIVITR
jgi:hypothetical protein